MKTKASGQKKTLFLDWAPVHLPISVQNDSAQYKIWHIILTMHIIE